MPHQTIYLDSATATRAKEAARYAGLGLRFVDWL
jgi:hypothetical protein